MRRTSTWRRAAALRSMLPAFDLERIPADDEALRLAIREFLDTEMPSLPAGRRARSWMGYDEAFSRRLAQATRPHQL